MAITAPELICPDDLTSAAIIGRLRERCRFSEVPAQTITRQFLDSFDWRIFQAGATLEIENDGQRDSLIWRDLASGRKVYELAGCSQVRFVDDLPDGKLKDRLQQVLAMRALLPLLEIQTTTHNLRILDEEEKTVVRVELTDNSLKSTGKHAWKTLSGRLRLNPVRGYDQELEEFRSRLSEAIALHPGKDGLLSEALKRQGRQPGDYTSKMDFYFDPRQRADQVARSIFLSLLDTLEANVEGTRTDIDTEFLHDFRVATRRTRSALTQIRGVLPPDILEEYKQRFAWLQQITGPTRDMDVYLLGFNEYQQCLPEEFQEPLEPLRRFLERHQKSEQQAMVRQMDQPEFRSLLQDWRFYLNSPLPANPEAPNALRDLGTVANERIWKMYRQVIKEGKAIHANSPAEELHELRKSCKKLRYLMEFFHSIYPKSEMKQLVKVVKVLLENLGDFQDLEVQAHKLKEIAHQMVREQTGGTDTLLAMGILVGGIFQRQALARKEFASCFADFYSRENRDLAQRLFRPQPAISIAS